MQANTQQLSLSTTGFGDASRCLKKYSYHFEERLVPVYRGVKSYMREGIWLHRMILDYRQGRDWKHTLDVLTMHAIDRGVEEEEADTINAKAYDIMEGYVDYWREDDADWHVEYAEQEFRAQLTPQLELRATIDAVATVKGARYLVEYKSTSHIPGSDWRTTDPQTAQALFCLEANGIYCDGVLFDYLSTKNPPPPRFKKNGELYAATAQTTSRVWDAAIEAASYDMSRDWQAASYYDEARARYANDAIFYQRFYTLRNKQQLRQSLLDIGATAGNILRARKQGHFPRSFQIHECGTFCPYAELCLREYNTGAVSELRTVDFMLDDGTREGGVSLNVGQQR